MHYVFIHPEGQNIGGVYTFGCRLHRNDPRCLSLVVEPANSAMDRLAPRDPRVRVFSGASVYDPARQADALEDLVRGIDDDIVFIPNYHHRCYDAAFEVAARLEASGRRGRVLGYCHSHTEYYYEMLRSFAPWLSGFVAVSSTIADELRRLLPARAEDVSLLPYPVEPVAPRVIATGPLRLLYAGRLEETQKRVSRLLDLAEHLQAAGVEIEFDLCGDGPERARLEAGFAATITGGCVRWRFSGAVSPEEVGRRFVAADVTVLVSAFEGYPLVLQEAMAAGVVPVVMAVGSGVEELIDHGRSGWIVPQGDVAAMAGLLGELALDRGRLENAGAAARARLQAERGLPAFFQSFDAALARGLAQPAPVFPRTATPKPAAMARIPEAGAASRRPRFYREAPEVVVVSHDATLTGAPLLLLTLLEAWRRENGPKFRIVLRSGGPLEPRFRALGRVWNMGLPGFRSWPTPDDRAALLSFCGPDVRLVYGNTGAVGEALEALAPLGCPVLAHIHELERMLAEGIGPERFGLVRAQATRYIAGSSAIARNLVANHGIGSEQIDCVPGCLADDFGRGDSPLPTQEAVILGVGTTDWRKGPDLFVQLAGRLAGGSSLPRLRLIWVGAPTEPGQLEKLRRQAADLGVGPIVEFVGPHADVRPFLRQAAVYACCSREEPFGLVALEAAAYGVPTVCFADAGGMPDFVRGDAGRVVPFEDVGAMAGAICGLLGRPEERAAAGRCARERLDRTHRATPTVRRILDIVWRNLGEPARR